MATIELARHVLSLHDYGVPRDTIMEREKISRSYFYELLELARPNRAQPEPVASPAVPAALALSPPASRPNPQIPYLRYPNIAFGFGGRLP